MAQLKKYANFDFRGGLDVKTSPQLLAGTRKFGNRLTEASNVVYPKAGGVSKRPDAVTYNTVTLGAAVTVIGGFQFRHSNGTDYNLCATNDGKVHRLNTDGTTTELKSGLTAATRAYFAQYNDLLIYTDRVNAPQSYDGTTWQALAGTPPSTGGPVAVHSNRAFMLDATNQRRLSWSALGDAEDWTTAGDAGSVTLTGRLGSVLVFLLPMTSELLVGARELVTRLQGTSPTTYALTNATPAMVSIGGIASQGAIFSNNDARWISQRGIHSLSPTLDFGDLKERFASDLIDPYFIPGSGLTLSLEQLTAAVACYDSQNNRDLFGVDTDADGDNDTILCRDIYTSGWSVWDTLSCASLWTAYTGASGVEVFMGGYDGFVRRFTPTGTANAISGSFKHISDLGEPFVQKAPSDLYVYLAEQSAGSLSVTTNFDFGYTGGQTYSVSQLGSSAVVGSTFLLGTSVLGARSQIIKRLRLQAGGVGEFLELQFANAQAGQPFTVNGYEVLYRDRRILARASAS